MKFEQLVEDILGEVSSVRKSVVRHGKVIKKRDCPPGYKLVGGTRCVRQSAHEKLVRRKAGKKASRKSKAKRTQARKRSVKVRQRRHLKPKKF